MRLPVPRKDGIVTRRVGLNSGGSTVLVEPHRVHKGVFICNGQSDQLHTVGKPEQNDLSHIVQYRDGSMVSYRLWSSSGSDLAAVLAKTGRTTHIKPRACVLYLGADYRTTSHVSDIVGPYGMVYAVAPSSSLDPSYLARKCHNVEWIFEDPMKPETYRERITVDVSVLLSEVHGPDQVKMMYMNASYFMKAGGRFVVSVKGDFRELDFPFTIAMDVIDDEYDELVDKQFEPSWDVKLAEDHVYFVGAYLGIRTCF
ncbi:hypothetical protein POM88_003651 [Heracleum sosnowskyi]|uniref:Fibrillarin n=1 Tax=Heracleum sosnowskyi TaxID=360622 RepID=A0AAD8JI17_9APIA|nr:hypothetical protein POM88_003651 [Heracleum sosnowskyi]